MPAHLLPPNGTRVANPVSFKSSTSSSSSDSDLDSTSPISGTITLRDGTTLPPIHRIIVCTGYHISIPFLRSYHNDNLTPAQADDTILVTDGSQRHNLHKDIFYIPDPTLAFIGAPYYTATFSLFEFQAIALAAVWAGRARLPSVEAMRKEYEVKKGIKGMGKTFHSLRGEEVPYAKALVEWINEEREALGGGWEVVEPHDEYWHRANRDRIRDYKARGYIPVDREVPGEILAETVSQVKS